MDSLNNSVSFNRVASLLLPGFVISFFILWILYLFNPDQFSTLKDYEFIIVFSLAVLSLLLGYLVDIIMMNIEKVYLKAKGINIRIKVLEKFKAATDEFDAFLFSNLNIHLYKVDKKGVYTPGDFNGKKIDNYNVVSFEKYMKYRLSEKETTLKELDFRLNQYLMFRNLIFPFLLIPVLAILAIAVGNSASQDLITNTYFVIISSIVLFLLGIFFFLLFIQLRKDYLFALYQTSNFFIKTLNNN